MSEPDEVERDQRARDIFLRAVEMPSLEAQTKKPLRVLLITGGCCHNYTFQTQSLKDAVAKLAPAEWTVVNEGGTGTQAMIPRYDDPNWAKGYDVVVHNECFADTKSPEYIRKITSAHHAGVPAVVIHCAMHTYRATDIDDWREFLGITSRRHDHQSRYPVKKVEPTHLSPKRRSSIDSRRHGPPNFVSPFFGFHETVDSSKPSGKSATFDKARSEG